MPTDPMVVIDAHLHILGEATAARVFSGKALDWLGVSCTEAVR